MEGYIGIGEAGHEFGASATRNIASPCLGDDHGGERFSRGVYRGIKVYGGYLKDFSPDCHKY
jgi:hypothetical protein